MATTKEKSNFDDILKKLDCPFTWDMESVAKDEHFDKPHHENDDEEFLPLLKLIRKLMTAYTLTESNGDYNKIIILLQQCDDDLWEIKDASNSEISVEVVEYVWKATKCFVYHKFDMTDRLEEILQEIKNLDFTTNKDKSTLKACRALCWSKYHQAGCYEAEKYIREAIEENPNCALWYFILAKNLRRQRRDSSIGAGPTKEEMSNFLKAMEMSKNIVFELFVAQVYRENHDTHKALRMYENVLKQNPKETTILLRLALGYIRLNKYEKAKTCLDKVGEKSPDNSMYLHYYGIYFKKQKKFKEAIPYYEKAIKDHNMSADKDYLQCLMKGKKRIDITKYLSNLLEKYNYYPEKQLQPFFLDLGLCYWKKENNVTKALDNFIRAIEINPKARCFTDYYDYMNIIDRSRNVFSVLKNQFLPFVYNKKSLLDSETLATADKLKKICDNYYINQIPGMEEALKKIKK